MKLKCRGSQWQMVQVMKTEGEITCLFPLKGDTTGGKAAGREQTHLVSS